MNRKTLLLASLCALALGGVATVALRGQGQAPLAAGSAAGTEEVGLRAAIDALFDEDAVGQTRALIVMRDGRILAERYGPGFDANTKLMSWSMAKSVTAVLIGLLVSDGRLALDEPAPVPAWDQPGDPRGAITLRQLLHMASGLAHVEDGDPVYDSDTVRMLFLGGARDMAAYAEAKPLAARPGSRFLYSTATGMILSDIVTRTLTESEDPQERHDAVMRFIRGRLIDPVGLSSLTPEFDARGTLIGGSFMHATARDYAKFGEFLRKEGEAGGRQVLSARWVDFMRTPSPLDPGYGGQVWLNRPRPPGAKPALFPGRGPSSLFACIGHQGQYILISPAQRLTIVRLGLTRDDRMPALRDALARLVEVFPAGWVRNGRSWVRVSAL